MHLPRDSATIAAIGEDDEYDDGKPAQPRPPQLTEFGPEVEALAGIHDLLASIVASLASLGGDRLQIDPYPRPVTAAGRREAAEQAARDAQLDQLQQKALAQLLPHKYGKEGMNGGV